MSLKKLYLDKLTDYSVVIHGDMEGDPTRVLVQAVRETHGRVSNFGAKYTVHKSELNNPDHFKLIGMVEDRSGIETETSKEFQEFAENLDKLKTAIKNVLGEHSGFLIIAGSVVYALMVMLFLIIHIGRN